MASAGKLVHIDLPKENSSAKWMINKDTTAGQIVDLILQRDAYDVNDNCYSLCLSSSPSTVLKKDVKLSELGCDSFQFRLVESSWRVFNHSSGEEFRLNLDPLLSVASTVELILKDLGLKVSIEGYELYLITNTSLPFIPSNGVRMEGNRTLSSYRLKEQDLLLLTKESTEQKIWNDYCEDMVTIIVNHEELSFKKAFKIPLSYSIATLISLFLEKANIKETKWFYGLFYSNGNEETELSFDWKLSDLSINPPIRVEIRKANRIPIKWFGTNPSNLPMSIDPDNGIEVPQILLILKDIMINLNGMETEGIFRLAGLESEMAVLKTKIEKGQTFQCLNPHSIATLIKRWYKELPGRLLEDLKSETSNEILLNLHTELSDIEYRLFNWLICLLLQVSENEEKNKMDGKNCAIVWGPALVGTSSSKAKGYVGASMEDFERTKLGITAVELNIMHHKMNNTIPKNQYTGDSGSSINVRSKSCNAICGKSANASSKITKARRLTFFSKSKKKLK